MSTRQKRQEWYCERCEAFGTVTYDGADDAMAVLNKIVKQHQQKRTEPDCASDLLHVGRGRF